VGGLHWLILVPYYFVGTLTALPLLMLICRLVRLKVAINVLVGTAIALSLAATVVPLVYKWLDLRAFTGRPMLILLLLSFLFAAVDGVLAPRLPLPLDDEIRDL
jgi:hypothetical protein